MSNVSSGKLSGKMKYRMVEPRMLMVSREMGSDVGGPDDRVLGVIFTVRNEVFMVGETAVMVPWTMVPFLSSMVTVSLAHFMRKRTSFMIAAVEREGALVVLKN